MVTDSVCKEVLAKLMELCGTCAARMGMSTVGPNARPRPSSCWACEDTAAVYRAHGQVAHVPQRNGNGGDGVRCRCDGTVHWKTPSCPEPKP